MTGDVLAGRFELGPEIGKTRAFREFRARDRQLNRTVSVKLLRVRRSPEPAVLARLVRHAREAVQLAHPHILRVYAAEADAGRFFAVEDFERAETLRARLDRDGPLGLLDALAIASHLSEAVSYAHGRGMCHGAITPDCVLVSPSGEVKLRDFASSGALVRAEVIGWDAIPERVPYLAPEQIAEPSAQKATDIHALGALLFEMLTGRPPFGKDAPAEVSRRIRTARPPDVDELVPEISADVVAAVARALAKRPTDRWASATDFAAALRAPAVAPPVAATVPLPTLTESPPPATATVGAPRARGAPSRSEPVAAPSVEPSGWGQFNAVSWAAFRGAFWLLMTVAAMVGLVLGIMWRVVAAMPEDRTVPDVVNKTVQEAQQMVEARDLAFRVARYEFHEKVPAEHVVKMSPYPGKTVKEGREVSVIVSRGEPLVRVPLLSAMQYQEAAKRLKELSLKPKKTGERPSEQVSKGGIVSQWPLMGQEVPEGSEVKLVVSSGRPSRRRHDTDDSSIKQYRLQVQLPPGDAERLVHIEAEEDGVPVDKYSRWHKGGETVEYTLSARPGGEVRVSVDEEEVYSQRLK